MPTELKITRENIDSGVVSEFEPNKFSCCASDLGLKPGQWWGMIETTLGNGQFLTQEHQEVVDGDLQYIRYKQDLGCITLTIFND